MNSVIERYKRRYGDGEVLLENNTMVIPGWLVALLVEHSGLKSRKRRLVRKRLKREVFKAILRGLASERRM